MSFERALQARIDYIGSLSPWWCPCVIVMPSGRFMVRPTMAKITRELNNALAGIEDERKERFLSLSADLFEGLRRGVNVRNTHKSIRDEFGLWC